MCVVLGKRHGFSVQKMPYVDFGKGMRILDAKKLSISKPITQYLSNGSPKNVAWMLTLLLIYVYFVYTVAQLNSMNGIFLTNYRATTHQCRLCCYR